MQGYFIRLSEEIKVLTSNVDNLIEKEQMRENRDYIMFDDVKEMNQKIFKLINDG